MFQVVNVDQDDFVGDDDLEGISRCSSSYRIGSHMKIMNVTF